MLLPPFDIGSKNHRSPTPQLLGFTASPQQRNCLRAKEQLRWRNRSAATVTPSQVAASPCAQDNASVCQPLHPCLGRPLRHRVQQPQKSYSIALGICGGATTAHLSPCRVSAAVTQLQRGYSNAIPSGGFHSCSGQSVRQRNSSAAASATPNHAEDSCRDAVAPRLWRQLPPSIVAFKSMCAPCCSYS